MDYAGIQCKLYPNKAQKALLQQTFGHTRFIWNTMLDMLIERYRNNPQLPLLSYSTLSSMLPQLKREYPWLKDVDSVALQTSVKTLRETYERFFKRFSSFPKFKSKSHPQSYTSPVRRTQVHQNIQFNANQRYLKIPKLGWVKCRMSVLHMENASIQSITVKLLPCGTYQASLLTKCESQALPKTHKTVGIDLGVSDLAITSDGIKYKSQKLYLKHQHQLKHWERKMARRRLQAKAKGINLADAKNYQRAKQRVARTHAKIRHTRKDYIHKITTQLVHDYDMIAIEDLKTKNLMKNHKLARALASQTWRAFREMLEYKCKRYGKTLIIVDPYKTSQLCSTCGHDAGKKALNVRHWDCSVCYTTHDRDINAGKNILIKGLEQAAV